MTATRTPINPGPVPYGEHRDAKQAATERRMVARATEIYQEYLAAPRSHAAIAEILNAEGFRTRSGSPWSRTSVFNLIRRVRNGAP